MSIIVIYEKVNRVQFNQGYKSILKKASSMNYTEIFHCGFKGKQKRKNTILDELQIYGPYIMGSFARYPSKSRGEQEVKHMCLNLAFSRPMTTEPWDNFCAVLKRLSFVQGKVVHKVF